MPVSTDKGFTVSVWESIYLRCRYRNHRNKIAAAKPAIDSRQPAERPHVRWKSKKALREEERQNRIFTENLRIVTKTLEIMNERAPIPTGNSRRVLSKRSKGSLSSRTKGSQRLPLSPTRPITHVIKKNNHVVLQWFLRKFGQYIPWWAQVRY